MTESLRELREQQERAHQTIRSWPDYMKQNIIVTALDGKHYLLGDAKELISTGRLETQPRLSRLISILPEKSI